MPKGFKSHIQHCISFWSWRLPPDIACHEARPTVTPLSSCPEGPPRSPRRDACPGAVDGIPTNDVSPVYSCPRGCPRPIISSQNQGGVLGEASSTEKTCAAGQSAESYDATMSFGHSGKTFSPSRTSKILGLFHWQDAVNLSYLPRLCRPWREAAVFTNHASMERRPFPVYWQNMVVAPTFTSLYAASASPRYPEVTRRPEKHTILWY